MNLRGGSFSSPDAWSESFQENFKKFHTPYSFSDIRCWCVERLELWFQAPFIPLVLFRKIFIPLKFSINCLRKWKLEIPTAVKNNVAGIFPGKKVAFFKRGNVSQNRYSSFTRYRRGRRKESGQQSISKTYRALVEQNEFPGFGLWIGPQAFHFVLEGPAKIVEVRRILTEIMINV